MNLIMQLQMLLAVLSMFLPLVPTGSRSRAVEIIDVVAKALAAGNAVGANLDDLAAKLAAIRAEVEAMAAGRAVSGEEPEAAMTRVRTPSAGFRVALEAAEAGAL